MSGWGMSGGRCELLGGGRGWWGWVGKVERVGGAL